MSNIVAKVTISQKDKEILETAWYDYSAMKELIDGGMVHDTIVNRFQKAYADYQKQWNFILKNYFEQNYISNKYRWVCNFSQNEVVISKVN